MPASRRAWTKRGRSSSELVTSRPAITTPAMSHAGPAPSEANSGAAVNAPIAAAAEPDASARPCAAAASSRRAASATAACVPGDWIASITPWGIAIAITNGSEAT